MIEYYEELDEIYKPNTIDELCLLTRRIIDTKKYLLIENIDERPVLVDILQAKSFSFGVELIDNYQYARLSEYFTRYGAIATLIRLADIVYNIQGR